MANQNISSHDAKRAPVIGVGRRWGAATKAAMSRKLVWIDEERSRCFGCSECGWRSKHSGAPTGTSFDEMIRNFELQRDKEFLLHDCATYPKAKGKKPQ